MSGKNGHNPGRSIGSGEARRKVLIAGGGIAAIEALLALRRMAPGRVQLELLAPNQDFVFRPLSVAEPFGLAVPRRYPLAEIAADAGAIVRHDVLSEVYPERKEVRIGSAEVVAYDALLIAIGVQAHEAVPGAVTFRGPESRVAFSSLLNRLEWGSAHRAAFAVPAAVLWALPLYELAIMTAAHLEAQQVEGAHLSLVTPEPEPLSLFGSDVSRGIRELLADSGIELITRSAPCAVTRGRLILASGGSIPVDEVVALGRPEVEPIPGLPQDHRGFIDTDPYMRVDGLEGVYAAGDATWFPIKQGGVATQQAYVAASAIAATAGADVPRVSFEPVLRGAMLTGSAARYLRAPIGAADEAGTAVDTPLWQPPSKVAGRFLSPYLAAKENGDDSSLHALDGLDDLDPMAPGELRRAEIDHRDAVELALTAANADARWRDYDGALRWLGVAERLNLALPVGYAEKRRRWRDALRTRGLSAWR